MNRVTSYALHIKPLFTPIDIEHMADFGLDLGTYDGVRSRAADISERLNDKSMPPASTGGPWPDEWIALFDRWVSEGFPQ